MILSEHECEYVVKPELFGGSFEHARKACNAFRYGFIASKTHHSKIIRELFHQNSGVL